MGDLNYDLLDLENNAINNFKDLMLSFSYKSLINKPTRIAERCNAITDTISTSATCLDQIWTTNPTTNINGTILTHAISDHLPVGEMTYFETSEFPKNNRELKFILDYRTRKKCTCLLNQMDYTNVVNQLDINVALDELSNIINTCTAECMKKKSSCSNKNRKNEPWYIPNLR